MQLEEKIAQMPHIVALTLDAKMTEFCNEVAAIYAYQLSKIGKQQQQAAATAAPPAPPTAVAAASIVVETAAAAGGAGA